jgi:hypothetical protein
MRRVDTAPGSVADLMVDLPEMMDRAELEPLMRSLALSPDERVPGPRLDRASR